MLTIYGVYRSRATRPIWLLEELGLPFRHVPVIQAYRLADPAAADAPLNTTSPGFLAFSPQGAIPVLDDHGFILTESLAITLYIARKEGGALAPDGPQETAQMMQWALYGATAIEGTALDIQMALAAGPATEPAVGQRLDAAAAKLRRPFRVLDAHLAAGGTMVGECFTVADINMAECVRYAQGHGALMAEFPALKRWLETCQSRAAFQKMWAQRNAEPA